MVLYTVGHSTRSFGDFVALVRGHGVAQIADVRTVPKSRRYPHFARESLERSLAEAGVDYRHFPALGGLRKPRRDSRNTAWRHPGFRGYADHLETPAFERALDELVEWASARPTAVMCAEAVWWQCHRQLIADALVARGYEVRHIMGAASAPAHTLTAFARVADGRVTYPGVI